MLEIDTTNAPDLHLEISTKCALKCPACPRTLSIDEIKITEIQKELLKKNLDFNKVYKVVSLCGDHGDPIYHSEFHAIIQILHQLRHSPPILIATNGSHRDQDWWKLTAQTLTRKDRVIFGIDGLEDTNHLYRRGADWDSIMTAIKTLKTYGTCQIQWQWILFNYNQHQIREGARLAKELGIDRFYVIDSSRDNAEFAPTVSLEAALAEAGL